MAGNLPDTARECDGKPSTRGCIAKQCFCNSGAALLTGEPRLQNGRQMIIFPICRNGASALQHQHHRGSGCINSLYQLKLSAGQVQVDAVKVLAAGLLVVAHAKDGDIRFACSFYCGGEIFPPGAVPENHAGAPPVIDKLNADFISASGLKVEIQCLISAFFLAPAINQQFVIHIQAHAVLRAQPDAAIHCAGHDHRTRPGNAETVGIQCRMRQRENPVEVDGTIRANLHRFALRHRSVIIAACQPGFAVFIAQHGRIKRVQRLPQKGAAALIQHLGFGADCSTDSVQHRNPAFTAACFGVVAIRNRISCRTDDCHAAQVFFDRQQAVILEQYDGFFRYFFRGGQVFRAAQDFIGAFFIRIRIFKQPQCKFHTQHTPTRRIQHRHLHGTAFNQVGNRFLPDVMRKVVKLQVYTGFQTKADGLLRRFGNKVPVIQAGNRRQVAANKPRHTKLPAQDIR